MRSWVTLTAATLAGACGHHTMPAEEPSWGGGDERLNHPSDGAAAEQGARDSPRDEGGEAADQAPPSESDVEDPVAEVVARCNWVRQSPDLPVDCQIDIVDNVARMQLVMKDRNAAQRYLKAAVEEIGSPFCAIANAESQPAVLVLALSDEQAMQVADCGTGRFSGWQRPDPTTNMLTGAAQACQELHDSPYPIACQMGVVDDAPALVLGYPRGRLSPEDLRTIGEVVADPFCEAMTANRVHAFVYAIEDQRRARAFDCATGESSGWVNVVQELPPRGPAPSPSVKGRHTDSRVAENTERFIPVYRTLPP